MIFTSPPPQIPPQPTKIVVWIHGTNPKHFLPSIINKLTEKTTSLFFHCEKGLTKSFNLDNLILSFILILLIFFLLYSLLFRNLANIV